MPRCQHYQAKDRGGVVLFQSKVQGTLAIHKSHLLFHNHLLRKAERGALLLGHLPTPHPPPPGGVTEVSSSSRAKLLSFVSQL